MNKTRHERSGVTLVGLLLIALIVVLLSFILMPTIGAILRPSIGCGGGPLARFRALEDGAMEYALDARDHHFPGQMDRDVWQGRYTGSQILGAHLFGLYDEGATDPYHKLADDYHGAAQPRSVYAPYDESMFSKINGRGYTLVNSMPKPKAICYYVSGEATGVAQYRFADNEVYTGGSEAAFRDYIRDPSASGPDLPVMDHMFLLTRISWMSFPVHV